MTYLRELNQWILQKPYPIPHIQDLLLKLEGFTYATLLDLNMGYYHTKLKTNATFVISMYDRVAVAKI